MAGQVATFHVDARVKRAWLVKPTLMLVAPLRFSRLLAPLAVAFGNVLFNRVRVEIRGQGARRWRDAGPLGMRLEYTP